MELVPRTKEHSKKLWTLEAIRSVTTRYTSLYKNIEELMEKPEAPSPLLESMLQFQEATGIEQLHELTPGVSYGDQPESLLSFLQSLAPYYLAGFLFERGQQQDAWWVTSFFFKGHRFDLDLSDQIRLSQKLPSMSPLQVKTAPTEKLLKQYDLNFVPVPESATSFLFRPTHVTGLLLVSESPELFARLKIDASLKLICRYFNT